jgi:hypothetical protein
MTSAFAGLPDSRGPFSATTPSALGIFRSSSTTSGRRSGNDGDHNQSLGDVPADAVAALDRPHPVGVVAAGREHRLVAVVIGAEPALAEHAFALDIVALPDRPALACPGRPGGIAADVHIATTAHWGRSHSLSAMRGHRGATGLKAAGTPLLPPFATSSGLGLVVIDKASESDSPWFDSAGALRDPPPTRTPRPA